MSQHLNTRPTYLPNDERPGLGKLEAAREQAELVRQERERAKQEREAAAENNRKEFRTKQVQLAVDSIDWSRVHSPMSRLAILTFAVMYRETSQAELNGQSREASSAEKAYAAITDQLVLKDERLEDENGKRHEELNALYKHLYDLSNEGRDPFEGVNQAQLQGDDSNDLNADALSQFDWGLSRAKVAVKKAYDAAKTQ